MMSQKADYWRKRISEMTDAELERWIEGIAHLKLRHACEGHGAVAGEESEARMSEYWKWVWAGLFLGSLVPAFGLVAIGEFWNGIGVLILAMVAFARFAHLYNREQVDV